MITEIDGALLEGGGQLLRMAIAYGAVSSVPIRVTSIRAKRPKPGLRPQHVAAVKAMASISRADVKGLRIGSSEIEFHPKSIIGGHYKVDIGTAGSIGLILQGIAPAVALAPASVSIELHGGTSVKWAVPVLVLKNVICPLLSKTGFRCDIKIFREGFYPKGGGIVKAFMEPVKVLRPLNLTRQGDVNVIRGLSLCGLLPSHVAERQAKAAERALRRAGYSNIEIKIDHLTGERSPLSPGGLLALWAETSTGCLIEADGLGERGKRAEVIGEEVAKSLIEQLKTGAAVDYHTADNLIIWASLAKGTSKLSVSNLTMHTLTAIELAKRIVKASFEVDGRLGEKVNITCKGIGLENIYL